MCDSSACGANASPSASVGGLSGRQLKVDPQTGLRIIDDENLAAAIASEFYKALPEWKMKSSLMLMSRDPPDRMVLGALSGHLFKDSMLTPQPWRHFQEA